MEKAIGGYFELELCDGMHYHNDAVRLNSGRNCFEYILLANGYKKVYIPYYTCDVMLPPLERNHIEYEYYSIDKKLEPVAEVKLGPDEAFLYTNYFGIKQRCVERLATLYGERLIVDASQAFYARRISGIDTFYSARKFFGVPDGAYLYCNRLLNVDIPLSVSYSRINALVKRIDVSAEAGYADFQAASQELCKEPMAHMSMLTERLLCSVDYATAAEKRKRNFLCLHQKLNLKNLLKIEMDDNDVPMIYPFLQSEASLKQALISRKIFVATYWPNVFDWCSKKSLEYAYAQGIISLPVDQRYEISDMNHILRVLHVL